MDFYEHHKRSLVKSATFRALVLISDFTVLFLITHRYELALGVIVATNASSTILYYFHERLWNGVSWGRQI